MMRMMLAVQLCMMFCLAFGEDHLLTEIRAELEDLKKTCGASQKVAFSAALRPPSQDSEGYGHTGPFTMEITLIHGYEITNVGGAYNAITGIFTAPVKGLYYFTFTTYSWAKEENIGVSLYKNQQEILLVWEYQDKGDNEDFASNAVTLQLEPGDTVYMRLPKGFKVTSRAFSNLSTFSGFLLFQL